MARLLGFIDILAGLLFIANFYQLDVPRGMAITFGIFLTLKGIIFLMNYFSLLDMAAGILLILGLTSVLPFPVLIGFAGFLVLKGAISLLTFS